MTTHRMTKARRGAIMRRIDQGARDNVRETEGITTADLWACNDNVQQAFRASVSSLCDAAMSDREHTAYVEDLGRPLTSTEAHAICTELCARGW